MTDFSQPTDVDDVLMAFPAGISHLMPAYKDIPDDFKHDRNPYVTLQSKWFFLGLKESEVPDAKPGIDRDKALRHLQVIQGSYEPKHKHKMAAVAYLASLWLEQPKVTI